MRIAIGSDHAGHDMKTALVAFLRGAGHEVNDAGTDSGASVDYPGYCAAVARARSRSSSPSAPPTRSAILRAWPCSTGSPR